MASALEAALPPEIFRAYDIRGVAGTALTEEGVYALGRAIGTRVRRAGDTADVVRAEDLGRQRRFQG